MSVHSVNTNILKRKNCKHICLEIIKVHQKIRSSSVMSVNKNVLKEIHKNHKEQTDIKLKTEDM